MATDEDICCIVVEQAYFGCHRTSNHGISFQKNPLLVELPPKLNEPLGHDFPVPGMFLVKCLQRLTII